MNSQASKQDFDLEPGYEPLVGKSLEQVIAEGETEQEKTQTQERISLNNIPYWLNSVLVNLKRRHPNVPSVAAVQRLTTKLGIVVIREELSQLIAEVEQLRRRVFELTDQLLLKKSFRGSRYELEETVGTTYRKCCLREWVAGAVSDTLTDTLDLTFSTAVLLVLIAGVSRSKTWVPSGWIQLANKELDHFQKYLEDEVRRLTVEILGQDKRT